VSRGGATGDAPPRRTRRAPLAAALTVLAAVAVAFQGAAGRITPWMDGDLQYHRAVALTMTRGVPFGEGPYAGLPSYLAGTYHVALAAVARAGLTPDVVLSVVSWFEPALWIAAAAFLAAGLWRRTGTRLAFVLLLLTAAGPVTAGDRIWVDALTLAGHVFWPLYPRDVAVLLLLVALGLAIRDLPVPAGLAAGLAVTVHPQIGAVAVAWTAATLALAAATGRRRRLLAMLTVAVAFSSWFWAPRLLWTLRYDGIHLTDFRRPLPLLAGGTWLAAGLLLPVGAVALAAARRRPASRHALAWLGVLLLLAGGAAATGAPILPLRRVFLLASLPLAVGAADGLDLLLAGPGRRRRLLALAVAAALLVTSAPMLLATRRHLDRTWRADRYATLEYPAGSWNPLLARIAALPAGTTLLAPERDAPVVWYRTGVPVPWLKRPGFVKTGFDVGRATGWPEPEREAEVTAAFRGGRVALCDLARRRHLGAVLLRSEPDLLGTRDWVPAAALRHGDDPAYADHNKYDALVLAAETPLQVPFAAPVTRLDVWILTGGAQVSVRLDTTAGPLPPATITRDGLSWRVAFRPGDAPGPYRVVATAPIEVLRVVGYEPAPGVDGPATLLPTGTLCPSA